MANKTQWFICKNNLLGGSVRCFTCPGYMHVKCSGLARRSDLYDDFSCYRSTSQFHIANETRQCNPPTLDTTKLPQFHPHNCTAPHSQNSREPSTMDSRTTQDPWSEPCPKLIETARKIYSEIIFKNLSKIKIGYNSIEL